MTLIPKEYLNQLAASPNDFDCIPRSSQVELYVRMLHERDIHAFKAQDICDIFKAAAMKSPRSSKTISVSPRKAEEYLDGLVRRGRLAKTDDTYVCRSD